MRRIGWRLAVVALAVLPMACDGDSEPEADGTGEVTTSTPTTSVGSTSMAPAGASATTEPAANLPDSDTTGKSELADGRHFGYWSSFEIGDTIAFGEFDLAFFLTGSEAEAAAAKKGETVENDYYIVNDNPKLRTLIARGDTTVRVLADDRVTERTSNVADFAVDRHRDAGFWVTIKEGSVTMIEEQYQP